jgi:uncharacterized protein (DUF433 family)
MPAIVNNRISGSRITVFDVFYYLDAGWEPTQIAELFDLSPGQIQDAVHYIEDHKDEVLAVHHQIEERNARGNPPEVLAKLEKSQAKMEAWLRQRRKAPTTEGNGEGHPA